ncbi:nucleoporin Pom152 [Massarina eburnea CBS 473.64]|uniref:Nucleoporin Pom152 n=1 Tax=Massarina eburnea CBS 473.64 TaxID=1395130 RepID=A0A6A6S320_9PLEO|nr:nucleoporin Pom152 [Massarina eburnea CBS 473.64]
MNETPRRGPGGFPATPHQNNRSSLGSHGVSTPNRLNVRALPEMPRAAPAPESQPLIPTDILDPAQQRLYVTAFYVALLAWKLYDWYLLGLEDTESFWMCLKWNFIDSCFIFGVPLLDIPWMQWSNQASILVFAMHVFFDYMLMFRIGIPFAAWAASLFGFLFDSEMAISERSVKQNTIIHNASLILGKQIINILPEGSAILNPGHESFCLNSTVTQLEIPILINQTEPIEMELLRIDIENNHNESITIGKRDLSKLMKKAQKEMKAVDPADPLILKYSVKKKGVYLLRKVLDKSKLEVRPRKSNAIIAACPQARVKPTGKSRCRSDLSNVAIEVEGVPPLAVKYRLTVDDKPRGGSEFQNLHQDEAVSPLLRHSSQALVKSGNEDVSWARPVKLTVPLNETLVSGTTWAYSVEEVRDGLGNFVNFATVDDEDGPKVKYTDIAQSFLVHERPKVHLLECNPQEPLRVAKGQSARLPIHYSSTGKGSIDAPHALEYLFTPEAKIVVDGYQSPDAQVKRQSMKTTRDQPRISEAGLYTLKSVSTDFCEGEVLEPTSCLLQNPPQPQLTLSSEDIVDKCAGNPIGLRVSLDFTGTPPFHLMYTEHKKGHKPKTRHEQVASLRGSLDLTPDEAGHYTYTFKELSDAVYLEQSLDNLVLQQDVKPPASAHFIEGDMPKQACIDQTAEFDVRLIGEGPFKLEYEIIHNGKRTKKVAKVEDQHYTISTEKLKSGGEYTIALSSITDKMNCKDFLKDEAKVQVRHERPKAYFGHIEGKQTVKALEGKIVELPVRLTGAGPWRLEYRNLDTGSKDKVSINAANSGLKVHDQGTYQLLSVDDSVCPGFIEEKADQFNVGWILRPRLSISDSPSIEFKDGKYHKAPVCEGDEDSFDVAFTGNAPFDSSYRQEHKDKKGKTVAVSEKEVRAIGSTASVRADTAKSGVYEYTFMKLADGRYDHSKKHFTPLTVQQNVRPRPSARFDKPGKTYSYCSRESDGEEVIPVTLEGTAPFYLEVEIKHAGTPTPEVSVHRDITSTKYDLKVEHRKLHLGQSSITIRKIRDAHGCGYKPPPGGPRVQISVHDAPSATAMEEKKDYCVGERLSFALGGQFPFTVYYTFNSETKKASNPQTTFRRLAELPGTFTITGLRDSASECLASLDIRKEIHPIPTVRLSGGLVSEVDIHEGGASDLEFSFTGTAPFEFIYTRSTNAGKGKKSKLLDVRQETSHDYVMKIPVQDEGTYEVVSIKDSWCSFARPYEGDNVRGKKLLTY